jgi:hypothetical protein
VQDLRCPHHPRVELSKNAVCPFCHPSRELPAKLVVDLKSLDRARADRELNALVPGLDRVAR